MFVFVCVVFSCQIHVDNRYSFFSFLGIECYMFNVFGDCSGIIKLGNELKRRGMVSYMELITGARVPIIKMTHLETGTDADICFDQPSGPRMGAMIKHMLNVVPAMKPLVLVLKYFLAQRKLNVTFKGKNSIRVKSYIRFVLVHSNFFVSFSFFFFISQVVWAPFYCN